MSAKQPYRDLIRHIENWLFGAPNPEEGKRLEPKDVKEVAYEPERCIGCGVCAHKCPAQSLRLRRTDEEQDYPQSMGDAGRRMMTERGRDFSEVF